MFVRRWIAGLFTMSVVALAASTTTPANADADPYTEEAKRWLGFVNRDCGTNITLEPMNVADLKARQGGTVNFCGRVFDQLRSYCQQSDGPQAGKPHPAGQAFIKENVKSISCKIGPDADKPVVKVSLKSSVLSFETTPKFSTQSETDEAMRKEPTLSKIWPKRRVWDLENIQIPEAARHLKSACGDDMTLKIDVPSWQARGKLLSYPDAAAADICANYARGIMKACGENKAKTRAKVSGIQCGLLPAKQEDAEAQIKIANKQVVVMLGTLNSNMIDSGDMVYKALK